MKDFDITIADIRAQSIRRAFTGNTSNDADKLYQEEQKSILEKGAALPDGTQKEWGGKKYIKQGGKWVEKTKGRGKKQEEQPKGTGGSQEESKPMTPKELDKTARGMSEEHLHEAIKKSPEESKRTAAHKELDRRGKEEKVQEGKPKGEGKEDKPEAKKEQALKKLNVSSKGSSQSFSVKVGNETYTAHKVKGENKYIAKDSKGNRVAEGSKSSKKDFKDMVEDHLSKVKKESKEESQKQKEASSPIGKQINNIVDKVVGVYKDHPNADKKSFIEVSMSDFISSFTEEKKKFFVDNNIKSQADLLNLINERVDSKLR